MKRIIYILAALAVATLTACGPKEDEKMIAMDNFMDTQNLPGLYRNSEAEYAFNKSTDQCYLNPELLIFRIMDEGGDKYIQFNLSKAPVVGESVDVEVKTYGMGLSNTSHKNLKVDKMEDNLCYLRSDAEGGYVGIILHWIE